MTRDFVIARYNEPVSWLNRIAEPNSNIRVYNKGGRITENLPGNCRVSELPNVGRESHTYLTYIIENYYNLPDYVTFLQANPFDHCPEIFAYMKETPPFCCYGAMLSCDANGNPHYTGAPIGATYVKLFNKPFSDVVFVAGAQFSVSRELIQYYKLEFYQMLMNYNLTNEQAPWILERYWVDMFTNIPLPTTNYQTK